MNNSMLLKPSPLFNDREMECQFKSKTAQALIARNPSVE